jgi:hypothetical protein
MSMLKIDSAGQQLSWLLALFRALAACTPVKRREVAVWCAFGADLSQ